MPWAYGWLNLALVGTNYQVYVLPNWFICCFAVAITSRPARCVCVCRHRETRKLRDSSRRGPSLPRGTKKLCRVNATHCRRRLERIGRLPLPALLLLFRCFLFFRSAGTFGARDHLPPTTTGAQHRPAATVDTQHAQSSAVCHARLVYR